jgi:hypothetical protein
MNADLVSPIADKLVELDALVDAKNEGYAGHGAPDPWANYRSAERLGLTALDSAMLRLAEKRSRSEVLYSGRGADRVGESLRETLMDSAAIALIAVALLDETNGTLQAQSVSWPPPECTIKGKYGYICTLTAGHSGNHQAKVMGTLIQWENLDPTAARNDDREANHYNRWQKAQQRKDDT